MGNQENGDTMFGLFKKDPLKKLNEAYNDKLKQAMLAQRAGNIQKYAELSADAEEIAKQIDELRDDKK